MFEDDNRGFGEIEGVQQHLLSKYEAKDTPLALSAIFHWEGMDINEDYPTNPANYSSREGTAIGWIVIHYTGGTGSGLANVRYYEDDPNAGASAHFFVGHASENAMIYRGVKEEMRAWHIAVLDYWRCDARNANSIGIEVCCHNNSNDLSAESSGWYFDPETVVALTKLVKALMKKYSISIDHIVRHYDCTGKICPAPWVHNEAEWQKFKANLQTNGAEENVTTKIIIADMNGIDTPLTTIEYKDENYIRLRDLADAQTDDKLTVSWDEANQKVIIRSK